MSGLSARLPTTVKANAKTQKLLMLVTNFF